MIRLLAYFGIGVLLLSPFLPAQHAKETRRPITIRAVEGLQFDPPRVKLDVGETVRIRFLNRDPSDMEHNLVLIKPDSLAAIQQASFQINQALVERAYVPDHEAVIQATKLLKTDEGDDFLFTSTEPGIYHYVCTYPGHSTLMYGALYVGEKWGAIQRDTNIPVPARNPANEKSIIRPVVKRFFLVNSGPAAIAVALEGDQNYCWDAGNCRLRYAWSGEFINFGDNSRSNGNRQVRPKGKEYWNGRGSELTYTIQTGDPSLKPDFKGYRLINGQPEFSYAMGDLEVTEFITTSSKGIVNEIKIAHAKAPLKIYAPGNVSSNVGSREGDYIQVSPEEATQVQLAFSAQ